MLGFKVKSRVAISSVTLLAGVLVAAPTADAQVASSASPSTSATTYSNVGALFSSSQSQTHGCSASVVHSTSGDLIVTAAHCVKGSGAGMMFAPGYSAGRAPYGYWKVTSAYATSGWLNSQKNTDDMVVLKVASRTINGVSRSIENVVGGAKVGSTATAGTTATAVGYVAGSGDSAISCTTQVGTTVASSGAFPTFVCGGYKGGTSGSPWLLRNADGTTSITGIIGGLYQGGCSDDVSYSSPVSGTLTSLVKKAESGVQSDLLPTAAASGC